VAPIGGHRVKSLREARRITSRFHQLNNEIGLIHPNPSEPEERMKKQRIEQEIEMLGGRDRYQQASVVTTTHHKVELMMKSLKLTNRPDQQMGDHISQETWCLW
jgi:hypothetical protein